MVRHDLQQNVTDLYAAWKDATTHSTQGPVLKALEIIRDSVHDIADKLGIDLHKTEGD